MQTNEKKQIKTCNETQCCILKLQNLQSVYDVLDFATFTLLSAKQCLQTSVDK